MGRTSTETIAISASPRDVFAFLAEPFNLPRWAPRFADAIRPSGSNWIVTKEGFDLRILFAAAEEQATVDIVAANDPRVGAFIRVVPSGDGSACVFTTAFPFGATDELVADQAAVVAAELDAIRSMVEYARDEAA